MRWLLVIAGLAVAPALLAQEATPPKKKAGAKKVQAAHKKPTADQIRKFNDLEKKHKKD